MKLHLNTTVNLKGNRFERDIHYNKDWNCTIPKIYEWQIRNLRETSTITRIETKYLPWPFPLFLLFERDIHYNKDWNMLFRCKRTAPNRFERDIHYNKDWNIRVKDRTPVKVTNLRETSTITRIETKNLPKEMIGLNKIWDRHPL